MSLTPDDIAKEIGEAIIAALRQQAPSTHRETGDSAGLSSRLQEVRQATSPSLTHSFSAVEVAPAGLSSPSPASMASQIELSCLKPEASQRDIEQLCKLAIRLGVAAVVVPSAWVAHAVSLLRGSSVKIATVVGFPLGAIPVEVKLLEAEIAIRNGATELEFLPHIGELRSGNLDRVKVELATVANWSRAYGSELKLITEAQLLRDSELAVLCSLARLNGIRFLKNASTPVPFEQGLRQLALLRQIAGPDIKLKAVLELDSVEQIRRVVGNQTDRICLPGSSPVTQQLLKMVS